MSPLLFLQFIDDMRFVVPETLKVALFADDVSYSMRSPSSQNAAPPKMVLNAD